jgi:hypothetical protein
MTHPVNEDICDWTECRHCDTENRRLGGGRGHADRYFNLTGGLWGTCTVHNVRWYVTSALGGMPPPTFWDAQIPIVEAVWRPEHDGRRNP